MTMYSLKKQKILLGKTIGKNWINFCLESLDNVLERLRDTVKLRFHPDLPSKRSHPERKQVIVSEVNINLVQSLRVVRSRKDDPGFPPLRQIPPSNLVPPIAARCSSYSRPCCLHFHLGRRLVSLRVRYGTYSF